MSWAFVTSWTGFATLVGVVALVSFVLWWRWRRWRPTLGSSPEAREAEARLWLTRLNDQR